jgi:cytochrome P450
MRSAAMFVTFNAGVEWIDRLRKRTSTNLHRSPHMRNAPRISIDHASFWRDPYPTFERLHKEAPIAYIPELNGTVLTLREDIATCEKRTDVFSSHQPGGLMNTLMGHNFMRKDGDAHRHERMAMLPAISPQMVKEHWRAVFAARVADVLQALAPRGSADFCSDYAMPASAEALKALTGLTQITAREMDTWSQAMIDGIANYAGDASIEMRCHDATRRIDAAISERLSELGELGGEEDHSLLKAFVDSGMPEASVRANIKLTISGGQNEPRDAIAGTVWALLTHPQQHALIESGQYTYADAFEEYVRWISPIGMSPRRVAKPFSYRGIDFEPEDRVFFLFGAANRDATQFAVPHKFDITRNRARERHVAFGAGPHFCAGAAASRVLIAEVAVPAAFAALTALQLSPCTGVKFGGWAFRGPLNMPVTWRTNQEHL